MFGTWDPKNRVYVTIYNHRKFNTNKSHSNGKIQVLGLCPCTFPRSWQTSSCQCTPRPQSSPTHGWSNFPLPLPAPRSTREPRPNKKTIIANTQSILSIIQSRDRYFKAQHIINIKLITVNMYVQLISQIKCKYSGSAPLG